MSQNARNGTRLLTTRQKAVMISHRNVIANVLQYCAYESVARASSKIDTQVSIGLLPFSHIYGLVVITHGGVFRGDACIVLPRFEMKSFLQAIQDYRIQHMCLVCWVHFSRRRPRVGKWRCFSSLDFY